MERVSIHQLLTELDVIASSSFTQSSVSIHQLLTELDGISFPGIINPTVFQFTSSLRSQTMAIFFYDEALQVSIHQLLTELDPIHPLHLSFPHVSIHQLLTELDNIGMFSFSRYSSFNSLAPYGARQKVTGSIDGYTPVSIHQLLTELDFLFVSCTRAW